jgi:hypothetical protein
MTDLQMLRALLSLPAEKLKERRAFQAMYDDLTNGKYVSLSKKQRKWVHDVFLGHRLDSKPIAVQNVPTKDKRKVKLDFGPLPKKPPGR